MLQLVDGCLRTTTTKVVSDDMKWQQVSSHHRQVKYFDHSNSEFNLAIVQYRVSWSFKMVSCLLAIILFIIVTSATPSSAHLPYPFRCRINKDCERLVTERVCIGGFCSPAREEGDICANDDECITSLHCIADGCECPDDTMPQIWGKCQSCKKSAGCFDQRKPNICLDDCFFDGMSYLPLAFAFFILVAIAVIFSVKIIKTHSHSRRSSSRQELINEDSPEVSRRGTSSRRIPRDFSTASLPDYAPPPPYSVAIASSPVLYSQPIVATIATFTEPTDNSADATSTTAQCTTATVTTISTTSSVSTIITPADKPADT